MDGQTAGEILTGVAMPTGKPKRLLVVDRTTIEVTTSSEFNLADLLIGARTPIVYTMGRRNLERLAESVNTALAELGPAEESR